MKELKIKWREEKEKAISFSSIEVNSFFEHSEDLYIKISDSNDNNAYNFTLGMTDGFRGHTTVKPREVVLKVK